MLLATFLVTLGSGIYWLIQLAIILLVLVVIWRLIQLITLPPPLAYILQVIFAAIAILILLHFLFGMSLV